MIGGSGSGKSTLGKALEDRFIPQLISYTTRPMREGEIQDVDYYFMNPELMMSIVRDRDIAEKTVYDGNEYGLFCIEIEEKLKESDVYFVCNRDGAEQIINIYSESVIPFWLNIDKDLMKERMLKRGDSLENIQGRIQHAEYMEELSPPYFEHIELNAGLRTDEQVDVILNTLIRKNGGRI